MTQIRPTLLTLACMLLVLCAPQAKAQTHPPKQILLTSGIDDLNTHAWAVYPNTSNDVLLVHVPPRDASNRTPVPTEATEPGTLQAARQLGSKFPLAVAAIDEKVYLVYPKVYAQKQQIMRVYSGRAVPSPVGSIWSFVPIDRFDSQPPIESGGTLIDFKATAKALWALLDEDGHPRLLTLDDTAWREVALPPATSQTAPSASAKTHPRWHLNAVGDTLILIDHGAPTLTPLSFNADTNQWEPADWGTLDRPKGDFRILSGERALTLISWDHDDQATLSAWTRSGVFTIASGLTLPKDAQYTVLDSVNELLGIQMLPKADSDNAQSPIVGLIEIDLSDGTTIYRGPPITRAPVTINEFRFLVGMMILIMVGVLVVVIMPDRPDAMRIPDGFALADPGRRLIATLIDVALVAALMGELFNVHPAEILTLSVIVRPDSAWAVLPATMLAGVVIMSLFERILGATPGKLLMGIRVVRAQTGPMQRPPFWAVLVRNVIKWILPPVAALALVDPESLHRGDRATRTLVATPIRTPAAPHDDQDTPV